MSDLIKQGFNQADVIALILCKSRNMVLDLLTYFYFFFIIFPAGLPFYQNELKQRKRRNKDICYNMLWSQCKQRTKQRKCLEIWLIRGFREDFTH